MQSHDEVFEDSASYIARIMERNKIPGSDFGFKETQFSTYDFLITYTYSFHAEQNTKTVAGGSAITGHHYKSGAYATTKNNYYRYATNPESEKKTFIDLAHSQLIDFFKSNKNREVWVAPDISTSYDCNSCRGTGKVTCSVCNGRGTNHCHSCGGSGSITESQNVGDGQGNARYVQVSRSCSSCGGQGRVTCYNCLRSGQETCSSCSGHGYFTDYCHTKTIAKPSTTYATSGGIYSQEVVQYFLPKGNNHLCGIMHPEITGGAWLDDGRYMFKMKAPITVVENAITARDRKFVEVAVNTVTGILYPPIFDHLLDGPSMQLFEFTVQQRQRRDRILGLYHKVKDHTAVHHGLLAYGKAGDSTKEKKAAAVTDSIRDITGGYVSSDFSKSMGDNLVHLMSRLAPHSTSWPWWFVGLLCVILELVLACHLGYGSVIGVHGFSGFVTISGPMIAIDLLFIFVLALPVAIVNWMVTRYRQRGVPNMHRPKVHHRKPIMLVIGVITITWYVFLFALYLVFRMAPGFYGSMTHYGSVVYNKLGAVADWHVWLTSVIALVRPEMDASISYIHTHHHLNDPIIWILLIFAVLLYFMPTIIASIRKQKHRGWVFTGNLFLPLLGGLPWLVMLYLAFL